MGAGRTALVSSLFGAARSRGDGHALAWTAARRAGRSRSPPEAIAAGLALVSEDRKRYGLVLEASVSENLTLASLPRFVRGFLARRPGRASAQAQAQFERAAHQAPRRWLALVQPALGRQPAEGRARQVAACTKPRVLFLDEPTRGIDVGAKAEIYRLIAELAEAGLGVVLVSSDLPELLGHEPPRARAEPRGGHGRRSSASRSDAGGGDGGSDGR